MLFHSLSLLLFFFFQSSRPHRDLHSFPTRRSSDLAGHEARGIQRHQLHEAGGRTARTADVRRCDDDVPRSEEHTSELQSPYDLVCRLLLEKKKKKKKKIDII